jgi:hypothetical protein
MKEDVQVDRMRDRLRQLYAEDEEQRISKNIRRLIEDPFKPPNSTGRVRPSSVLLLLAILVAIAAGTFLYFSLGDT